MKTRYSPLLLTFTAVTMVLAGPIAGIAQVPAGPVGGPVAPASGRHVDAEMQRIQALSAELGLNRSQETQIIAIVRETRVREKAVKEDPTLQTRQKQIKMREIRKSKRNQISTVLTPAQRAQYKQLERAGRA